MFLNNSPSCCKNCIKSFKYKVDAQIKSMTIYLESDVKVQLDMVLSDQTHCWPSIIMIYFKT